VPCAVRFRRTAVLAAVLAAGASTTEALAQRQPLLSPRDTVRMELPAGRRMYIEYGRPSMRGRRIMGNLVPFGRVWRTGANAATTLVTEVDLEIAGHRIPRGTYTLYTLPGAGAWTLIVNRQTGQWGTQYEPTRDLVRIPMRVSRLERPVERFTISLEPARGRDPHTLALTWENTRAWIPFRVAPPAPPARPRPR
jgi:DUF2911 family protein